MPGKATENEPLLQPSPINEQAGIKNIFGSIPQWAPQVVIIVSALLYSRALFNGFTSFDDDAYIINNALIRDFTWSGVKSIFTAFYAGNYHPLTLLTYWVEYACFGLNSLPYHLLNVLLHLLNTWLVFKVSEKLSSSRLTALVVCTLFAIHPMHVESVAWVAERKDVLYSSFFLLSLLFYLRYLANPKVAKYYFASLLVFILSLLSKSAAVTLPVLLIVFDVYKGRTIDKKALIEKMPFFALSVLFGIWNIMAQNAEAAFNDLHIYGAVNRIFLFTSALSFYFVKLAAPFNLSAMHFLPKLHRGALPGQYYTSMAVVLLMILLLVLLVKRSAIKREILFGLSFFLVTISVMLQIVAVGSMLTAERYTYVPYIGLFYIIGQYVSGLEKHQSRQIAVAIFGLVSIIFSAQTWARIGVWKNNETLYADIRKKQPETSTDISYGFCERANEKKIKGDIPGAILDYTQAILLYPKSENAWCSRGEAYALTGNTTLALVDINRALSLNPKLTEAYNNRGGIYYKTGDIKSALADFNKAIALKPELAEAYNNKGGVYYRLGDTQSAILNYNRAIALKPAYGSAYNNLGTAHLSMGDTLSAVADYSKAIAADTTNAEAYDNRGLIYFNRHNLKQAIADYDRAIQLNPRYAAAYNNRGWAYYLAGNIAAALPDYDMAISLSPDYEAAYNNRGCAFSAAGNFTGALSDYNKAISLNPKNVTAYYNIAAIKANTGDLQGALKAYNYFLSLQPNDNMGYNDRGTVRYNLKDVTGACADWKKAAELGNSNAARMVLQYCR